MSKFYEEYREHREQQSITLEEISERTKINIQFLKAIEDGNFEILPETYSRLFLRAYANEIGIDPDKAIENYNLMHGKPVDEKPKPEAPSNIIQEETTSTTPSSQRLDLHPRKSFNWKQSLIVVLVFAFILWAVKSYVGSNNETEPQNAPTKNEQVVPADTLNQQQDSVKTPANKTAPQEKSQRQPQNQDTKKTSSGTASNTKATPTGSTLMDSSFTLQLNATQRTWVRVQRDTFPSNEFTFYGNDSKTWHADKDIRMMIGNAAGAQLQVGNKRYTNLGAPNQVVSVRVTRNGIVEQHTVQPNSSTISTGIDTAG